MARLSKTAAREKLLDGTQPPGNCKARKRRCRQARLGRRHLRPPLQIDFWFRGSILRHRHHGLRLSRRTPPRLSRPSANRVEHLRKRSPTQGANRGKQLRPRAWQARFRSESWLNDKPACSAFQCTLSLLVCILSTCSNPCVLRYSANFANFAASSNSR